MVVAPQCVLFLIHSIETHNGFLYWVANWTALQLVPLVCRLSDYSFKRRALFEGPVPCHPCASQRLLGICNKKKANKKANKQTKITQDMLVVMH